MLSVPKRLRYFLHDDAVVQGVVLRILVRAVGRCLRAHSPGCSTAARLGAAAFIHRFGSALNEHLHFHCCILDGVFESAGTTAGVNFHAALGLAAAAVRQVQARVRQQVLRAFVRRGLLEQGAADEMGGWDHGGGFSLDASVRIEGVDRAGRERLLRWRHHRVSPSRLATSLPDSAQIRPLLSEEGTTPSGRRYRALCYFPDRAHTPVYLQ